MNKIIYDKQDVEILPEAVLKDDAKPIEMKHVLWSGGFDSTAIVLGHLNSRFHVQPYYMIHSTDWEKCKLEIAAQESIREFLGNPSAIRKTIFWDYDQLCLVSGARLLSDTLDELAEALHMSRQYSALRFCKDVVGCKETLQLGIVRYDELWTNWERIRGNDNFGGPIKKFFTGFEFPIWDKMKRDIWDGFSPRDREVLKKTFSCEKADGEKRSCVQRRVEYKEQCVPCQHRIPEVA